MSVNGSLLDIITTLSKPSNTLWPTGISNVITGILAFANKIFLGKFSRCKIISAYDADYLTVKLLQIARIDIIHA